MAFWPACERSNLFNLEQSIADWRRQMLAVGIKTPVPLEELESHLREDVENQMRSGVDAQPAFENTVRQIGQTGDLRNEFAKANGTVYESMKQFFGSLAGIPNYQPTTNLNRNMNTPLQTPEPRWATYFKNITFILPAIFLWAASCVLVLPKLKQICVAAHTPIPGLMLSALVWSDFFKHNFLAAVLAAIFVLILLEWRSRWWGRRRRLVFGIAAFLLNATALLVITTLFVLAVFAGSILLNHAR
jgi:hypothetical protein